LLHINNSCLLPNSRACHNRNLPCLAPFQPTHWPLKSHLFVSLYEAQTNIIGLTQCESGHNSIHQLSSQRGARVLFAEDGNVTKAFEESILRSIAEREAKICET